MPVSLSPDYRVITANPTLTGYGAEFEDSAALVIGLATAWASNLRKIATLDGSYGVPDIPKGTISVTCLIPPTGLLSPMPVNCMDTPYILTGLGCPQALDLNGVVYENTFYRRKYRHAGLRGRYPRSDRDEDLRGIRSGCHVRLRWQHGLPISPDV